LSRPRAQLRVLARRLTDAREIAFGIGHEHGHADAREVLGQDLQRDRLAGAGRPGDQAVPVREAELQELDGPTFAIPE
jgi:hypothetical protein